MFSASRDPRHIRQKNGLLTRKLQPKQALCHHNYAKNVNLFLITYKSITMTWQRYDISDGIVMS